MKKQITAAALTLTAASAQAYSETAHYTLGFYQSGNVYRESHVAICDDTSYTGFTVTVPGRLNDTIKMHYKLDEGCAYKGAKVFQDENGKTRTKVFIKGSCTGSLEFYLQSPARKAVLESHDAC